MNTNNRTLIGLIPAGGQATRLAPLPMSKELYPIIGRGAAPDRAPRAKVASQYVLERMANAGVREAFFILRPGKWDIPAFFGDGSSVGIRLAYLTVNNSFGVPFTLDQAFPFVRQATIVLGFPDMIFWPETAYRVLLRRLANSPAQVVLGLFLTNQPTQVGLVDVDDRGIVSGLYEKSSLTHLPFMWAIAVWNPTFTAFLHEFVETRLRTVEPEHNASGEGSHLPQRELPIGDVIHAAIQAGMRVEAEIFRDGSYIDIGTPNNLLQAIRHELPVPAPRSPKHS
jgi:glucose-1-phosphate thymidylyltransferase